MGKNDKKKGPISSIAEKKGKQLPEIPKITVEFNGKKYSPIVHALHKGGKDYTAEEFMNNEEVLKFLVEETFDRLGASSFIKEVFE